MGRPRNALTPTLLAVKRAAARKRAAEAALDDALTAGTQTHTIYALTRASGLSASAVQNRIAHQPADPADRPYVVLDLDRLSPEARAEVERLTGAA